MKHRGTWGHFELSKHRVAIIGMVNSNELGNKQVVAIQGMWQHTLILQHTTKINPQTSLGERKQKVNYTSKTNDITHNTNMNF